MKIYKNMEKPTNKKMNTRINIYACKHMYA